MSKVSTNSAFLCNLNAKSIRFGLEVTMQKIFLADCVCLINCVTYYGRP